MTNSNSKAFVFFCGSSSCGKTTLTEQFPAIENDIPIIRTEMSFRNIRAKINNPSWEELEERADKATYQQEYGMQLYNERIYEKLENDERGIFLFERCPYDIVGYSHAFGLSSLFVEAQQKIANLIFKTISTNHKVVIAYRQVDWSFPFDRQNNARPDVHIRRKCDQYCSEAMNMLHSEIYMPPRLKIRYSVDQSKSEVDALLNMVM